MKKIFFVSLVFVSVLFAKTETIELTGEYSQVLINPFKEALNIKKQGSINIFSETKDVVLSVDSNIEQGYMGNNLYPDKIVLKNKSVEAVTKSFYNEDYTVINSKENAVIVDVQSGSVYLTYSNFDDRNGTHSLMGVEVTLTVSILRDGKIVTKKMELDHKLAKAVAHEDYLTTDDFDYSTLTVIGTTTKILENIIMKDLN